MTPAYILTSLLLFMTTLNAQMEKCSALDHHGKRAEAESCYKQMIATGDSLARAQGYLALRDYQQAYDEFSQVDKQHPNSAAVKTAFGNLYLTLAKTRDAANEFEQALKLDPDSAPAYVGLSRAMAENFGGNSVSLARQALEHDSKYFPAHELLAYLALETGDKVSATSEAQNALAISSESLDGMAVLAAIDFLKGNGLSLSERSAWMQRILKIDPYYGEAYAIVGHFFEMNYRYAEAIAAYRKSLDLEPALASARSELGINLMRLGQTQEAQQQLARAYHEHYQNAETRNSLRFLDTVDLYEHFSAGSFDLVVKKTEASLLRPYIEPELQRAISTYEQKYKAKLPGPVRLEVYPNHDDFVVRTLGLPGQGGLLGVTFGPVVAIDSPSARSPGDFSWADTMWHELCHVYVITATHNLVPRWFSEGLAVHEEGVASTRWGNRLTPDTVIALKQKKLLPVLQLDAGFVRPQYEGQVLVSYYQAGQICDYVSQRWGHSAILGMIHSYAAHKSTQEAIFDNLHETPDVFDRDFQAWLENKTESVVSHFDQWKDGIKSGAADIASGKHLEALNTLVRVQDYYPDYPGTYDLIAKCYASLGKKPETLKALEHYQENGGTGIDRLKQLAQLQADSAHPEQAIRTLEEINLIYPEDQEHHQTLGALLLKNSRPEEAVLEYKALLTLNPTDVAESHLNLAQALSANHQTSEAKDQVLLALEAAPNYKPAQKLLLQLSR